MKTGNLRKLLILTILFSIIFSFACGTAKKAYNISAKTVGSVSESILPEDKPILKKKVLVAPIVNLSDITASQVEKIRQGFISYLEKDEYLIVTPLKQWDTNDPESMQTQYGIMVDHAEVISAEKMGMDTLFYCVIEPIEVTKKRTGMWFFRKDTHNVLISINIKAVDTVTGTLVFNENESRSINAGEVNTDDNEKWLPDYNLFYDEISSLMKTLCSAATKKLRVQAWHGLATDEGGNIVIKAGRDVGINENTVFELFEKGESVSSLLGDKHDIFGEKLGESGVKSLSENKSVLTIRAGKYNEAEFIRVKR